MRLARLVCCGLALAGCSAFAGVVEDCQEAIETIASWQGAKEAIAYEGADRSVKAYAAAHNTALKTIAKEEGKIKKAKETYQDETSFFDHSKGPWELNKPVVNRNSRQAVLARAEIKRNDAVARAERGIKSAKKKRMESQKLALQDIRRKLKNVKPEDEEAREKQTEMLEKVNELIKGLSAD